MVSLTKPGNKWKADIHFKDARIRITLFPDQKASQKLADFIAEIATKKYTGAPLELSELKQIQTIPSRIADKLSEIGILDKTRQKARLPLNEHITAYISKLRIEKRNDRYIQQTERQLLRICQDNDWTYLQDISLNKFLDYVNTLRKYRTINSQPTLTDEPASSKTKRDILSLLKSFYKYLYINDLVQTDIFKQVKLPKVLRTEQVHQRRALTLDEATRLLEAAKDGIDFRGIPGHERYLIYKLSLENGLRANEIKTLTVGSFNFQDNTFEILDGNEKARRGATLPLRNSTARELKAFLKGKLPQTRAFNLKKPYMMIKLDLKAAGIPYELNGQFADFHCLRHTASSLLVASGANLKIIQTLMRHTDIKLTLDRYTHLYTGQIKSAMEALPEFKTGLQKTGTNN